MADPPAVVDQRVVHRAPLLRRQLGAHCLIHLVRRVFRVGHQPQPVGEAENVGIHRKSRDTEREAQHYAGGLAAHAGQGGQLLHGMGDLAAVLFHDHFAGVDDIRCFRLEPAAFDVGKQDLGRGFRHGSGGREVAEHGGRHLVDPFVGALSGQNGRHQRLVGVFKIQFGLRVRISGEQDVEYGLLVGHCGILLPYL